MLFAILRLLLEVISSGHHISYHTLKNIEARKKTLIPTAGVWLSRRFPSTAFKVMLYDLRAENWEMTAKTSGCRYYNSVESISKLAHNARVWQPFLYKLPIPFIQRANLWADSQTAQATNTQGYSCSSFAVWHVKFGVVYCRSDCNNDNIQQSGSCFEDKLGGQISGILEASMLKTNQYASISNNNRQKTINNGVFYRNISIEFWGKNIGMHCMFNKSFSCSRLLCGCWGLVRMTNDVLP